MNRNSIKNTYQNIDEYISLFPLEIQETLIKIRNVIKQAAPEATEKISYQMPTFFLHKNLVHFAVCKDHIGFYPTASGIERFIDEISKYKYSKGAIQFPINKPIPYDLIERIVKFRVEENKLQMKRK